jgi:hypothetical protein
MATQVTCGFPLYVDGAAYPMLAWRQFGGGTAVIDSGASALALTPAGGVYQAQAANLKVTAPVSGLTVNVAPGYCMVPAATAQAGGYRFGLMAAGVLTVPANATGSTRQDYVLATVTDLGSSSSTAVIQYVTGTASVPAVPPSSIILAQLAVTNGATSITSGMITDKRGFVCAPGGILHLPSAARAIAAPASQFFWESDTGTLVQGGGTAGHVTAYSTSPAGQTEMAISGDFPGVEFEADGMTDFEIYYSREPNPGTGLGSGFFGFGPFTEQVYVSLVIDFAQVDRTYAWDTSSQLGRVSATWYSSSGRGTTPSAGLHVARLSGTASDATHTIRVSPVIT